MTNKVIGFLFTGPTQEHATTAFYARKNHREELKKKKKKSLTALDVRNFKGNPWQFAKNAWLYSDLARALNGETLRFLASQQRGPASAVAAPLFQSN